MKKALSLLITAAMLVAMFAVMAPAAFAAETKTVGTADELIDVVTKINAGELPADTNITLSADIDLTGKTWKPLKVYNGTFDGNGKTITGATINVTVANNNDQKLDGGAETAGYVIAEYPGASDGNFGEAGFALLAVKAENATIKNFTLKDGTVNTNIGFNRNWQMHYGGVVAYMVNSTISDVDLVNVDVPVHANASDNQPFLGLAGIMAGVTFGNTTIENCSIDGDSSVNASDNAKYDVAAFVGRHSKSGVLTVKNCTTAATVTACATADRNGFHDAQKNDSSAIGCWAAAALGRVNNDAEGVVFLDVTNTGTITGASVHANGEILIGDNQLGNAKVRFLFSTPFATNSATGETLTGAITEPWVKTATINNDGIYLNDCDQAYFVFEDELASGELEFTIKTNAASGSCNGLIFCLTDADSDRAFWEGEDMGCYWLFVDEANRVRVSKVGKFNGGPGWQDLIPEADWVDLDNENIDVTAGVTLGVEFDGEGSIQVFVEGEQIYDITDNAPLTGTLYGLRLKANSASGAVVTSVIAGCQHENTETVGAKDATETENGYTGDKVCSDCGAVLETGKTIPATGAKPPKTGDLMLTVSALALVAAAGAAIIVRKRKIEE